MAGKYLRGALIEFSDDFPLPLPNVISLPVQPGDDDAHLAAGEDRRGHAGQPPSPLAVTGSPEESFSFTLAMDAGDMIADGGAGEALARTSGVYTRLAALEMLLFPVATAGLSLVGTVSVGGASVSIGGGISSAPTSPGPRRAPADGAVRLGTRAHRAGARHQLTITEKLYDSDLLNPTHAEAQIELKVLTPEELQFVGGPLGVIGKAA